MSQEWKHYPKAFPYWMHSLLMDQLTKQPWARTELEWVIAWELMVLLAWVWITMPLSVESSSLATGGSMSC